MENCFVIENGKLICYVGNEQHVVVPEVEILGEGAFKGNSSVRSLVIPDTVKVIEKECFECCYNLETVKLSSSLKTLGLRAFSNCIKLSKIEIPQGVKIVPTACFFFCPKLSEVVFPASIITIRNEAFSRCVSLKSVTFQEGLETIEINAFYGCNSLKEVTLPSTIQSIGSLAFGYCKYLPTSSLSIPELARISSDAFAGCCKIGYRSIRCHLYCEDEDYEIDDEFDIELKDNQTIAEEITSNIPDIICDSFQDLIEVAMSQYELGPQGNFDIYDIMDKIYAAANDYIDEKTSVIKVKVDELNLSDRVLSTIEIDLAELLKSQVESRSECEQADVDAGGYVEASLEQFANEGSWQFALASKDELFVDPIEWPSPVISNGRIIWSKGLEALLPLMWFGLPDEEPVIQWIAKPYNEEEISIWFEEDECAALECLLSEPDGSFLVWYFHECGRCIPDIRDIRESCPVRWDKSDSEDKLQAKISDYMVKMMKKFGSSI